MTANLHDKCDLKASVFAGIFAGMSWLEWCAIKDAVERVFEEEKLKSGLEDKDALFRALSNKIYSYELLSGEGTEQ